MQELDNYRARFGSLDVPKYESMKAIGYGEPTELSAKKHVN
jgi:hypothetical protein